MSDSDPASLSEIHRRHVETYESNPDRVEADAGTERQDRADYEGRFVFELLQNAVDEMDDTDEPRIRFELTEDSLLVANNGAAFSIEDLYALTLTTRTTKAGETTIGHKGRGFTSVLGVTDNPRVFSETVQAEFDRDATADLLNDDDDIVSRRDDEFDPDQVPLLCLPHETTTPASVRELLDEGFTTVFELPLREPDRHRESIRAKLAGLDANTVALLPQLEAIEISCPDEEWRWGIDRHDMRDCDATLIELTTDETSDASNETNDAGETRTDWFCLFEQTDLDRERISERADLTEQEVKAMGELSVGVAFTATPLDASSRRPEDWRLAPVYGDAEDRPPYLHVFLPTTERSPVPALVTGTFQSDTSRRNLTLDHDNSRGYEGQFNALLFAAVGDLVADRVVPFVERSATTTAEFLDTLDPSLGQRREWSFTQGTVEDCLFGALREYLASVSFLPSARADEPVALDEVTVPPTSAHVLDLGADFVSLLQSGDERRDGGPKVPASAVATHRHVRTLVAYGATQYDAASIPGALADAAVDPALRLIDEREYGHTPADDDEPCRLTVDPVLDYLVRLRKTLESDEDRSAFDEACRRHTVFPVEITTADDGTVRARRGSNETGTVFMPPEGEIAADALPEFEFLPRELYHGTNPDRAPALRDDALPPNFDADVQAIWDVGDYQFSQVFDAAISPHLPGPNSPDADPSRLASDAVLDTVREMTDVQSPENDRSPDAPLLYQSAKKPFSALAQLPVPTQPPEDGDVEWYPAHRVYFSSAWQTALGRPADAHVESLLDAVDARTDSERYDPKFLAPPSWFVTEEDENESRTETLDAWAAFFSWLGVFEHLRPLPLFAPGEQQTYRQTGGIERPSNSTITSPDDLRRDSDLDPRYTGLTDAEWEAYREHLTDAVEPEIPNPDERYLFQVNALEYASEILSAAKESDTVGRRLLAHLTRWWDHGLSARRHAVVAEFTNECWRGSNVSYVFSDDEKATLGRNLWVWQLRQSDWVPTGFGAVRPTAAWSLPERDCDRFSLDLNGSQPLLPFVDSPDFPTRETETPVSFEELTDTLGIGVRLEQGAFSPQDAARVLGRIGDLLDWTDDDLAQYSSAVELLYTRVAELLPGLTRGDPITGEWRPKQSGLADALVLCRVDGEYALRRADDTYFVRSRSSRERYGGLGVPLLALFKPAVASLGAYCGATDMRAAVEKEPGYGDDRPLPITVSGFEIDAAWLRTVLTALVLRLRTNRPSTALVDQDTTRTRSFFETVEFVTDLDLNVSLVDGSWDRNLDPTPQPYHIERDGDTVETVLIDSTLDRDAFVDALTGAYTDRLDVPQYYEAVNNLVDHAFGNATPIIALRERLRTVGSEVPDGQIDATRADLFEDSVETAGSEEYDAARPPAPEEDTAGAFDAATTVTTTGDGGSQPSGGTSGTSAHSSRVPSIDAVTRIGDSRIAESLRDAAAPSDPADDSGPQSTAHSQSGSGARGGSGAASQEYRDEIDAFGMAVTMNAERNRLADAGESDPDSKVFDVHTPEMYGARREDSRLLERAIQRFAARRGLSATENPLNRDWPGFDVLTIKTGADGEPVIDRCIELKTSGVNTQKPSLSWNEWKAAGSALSEYYYLYVARNIRVGNSGDAEILEIPQPFKRLRNRQRETHERNVQVDLRSFDFDDEPIIERAIEWEE
ncbi:hypothetical protein MBEHAL_0295 [Halarchaeum acidiphilum MH1-52-1]|uniref:Protein NO VEIN C-terminal domain-containing protein n=1 Tax=Halarchaeum acidiphilum MH1-52-1 TaxID=1261545 RepID=U2YRC3_9EURY|nr:hypothetical protein [Halarchaeum acidiphilum]GAD51535.1 hypothetical protein MBEHAL_0295 [Halarchaeum acidiphilum MH1-52-1]